MNPVPDTFPGMFWGYAVIFGFVVLYIVCLAARLAKLERRLDEREPKRDQ